MTQLFNIIPLNGFLYAVSNTPSIYIGKRKHVFCTAAPNDFGGLRLNCETGFCELCRDVLFSNDPSLNLPLLPAIEEDISLKAVLEGQKIYTCWDKDDNSLIALGGYQRGYKAASAKKYTEEDIIDAAKYGFKYATESQALDGDVPKGNILQWLYNRNPIPTKVEIETEAWINDGSRKAEPEDDPTNLYLWKPKVDKNNYVTIVKYIYD